jgi:hypothetical protein
VNRFNAQPAAVRIAVKRSMFIVTAFIVYRLGLPVLDNAGLLTQVLAPGGSQIPALITIIVTVILRMFLVLVSPIVLVLCWGRAGLAAVKPVTKSRKESTTLEM